MTNPMRYEETRLSTFKNWPSNAKVEARKIAKAGFFHTGNESEVQCSWCNVVLSQWEYGDQVMAKHRYANPNCPFILNISDNVPLILNSSTSDSETNQSDEVDIPPRTQLLRIRSYSPTSSESFKSEATRLNTFEGWPLTYIDPAALARSGFVYTGSSDCVRCVFCGEYVGDWDQEDDPEEEHRNLFSHCPFVRGLDVGNVPISRRPYSSSPSSTDFFSSSSRPLSSAPSTAIEGGRGYDEVGIRPQRHQINGPYSGTNSSNKVLKLKESPKSASEESIGIIKHSGPAHPKYSTVESRLRTFAEWPPSLIPRPKELSEAGFYYIGLSDQVRCFSCDGGLRNWTPEDDPWTEHARWFSKCGFVRLIKGDEFIKECCIKKPTDEAQEALPHPMDESSVDDEKLTSLMSSPIIEEALSMGIDHKKIKDALKKKISETGTGFASTSQLMNATFGVNTDESESIEPVPKENTTATAETTPCETTSSNSTGVAIPSVNKLSISPKLKENADVGSDLESENRMLKEQRMCKICMDNEIGVVFLPCGHLICCTSCAPALQDCPLCRTSIKGTVKTYMS